MAAKINMKGSKHGMLTVISEAEPHILPSGKPRTMWHCQCECGNYTTVSTQSLVQGTTVSCGCHGRKARNEGTIKSVERRLVGKSVGRWFIESYAGQRIQPSGQTRSLWNCTCECGTKKVLSTNQLTEGSLSCGCLRSELRSLQTIDLTGKHFNYLVVEERAGSKRYGKDKLSVPMWKCRCFCGKECVVSSNSLVRGNKVSCGCKRRIDLTGLRFGLLTAIEYDEDRRKWLCRCVCGNLVHRTTGHLRSGETISCGCKAMSKSELIIYNWLKEREVKFIPEYSFKELKGPNGGLLRFDFAIINENNLPIALIEYQGLQHFEEIENFGTAQREITDFIKRLYCDQVHIPLYTINYDEDIIHSCEIIMSKINSAHANAVPSL